MNYKIVSVWAGGWLSLWVPVVVTCSVLIWSCRIAVAVAFQLNWTAWRPVLFWVITQREVVIYHQRFVQPIGSFFMGRESKSFVVMGFYDCHNEFYAFIHISVKGTTWKLEIRIYRQRLSYHKLYCSVLCMECNEELYGQISESLVDQTNVREARKI